MTNTQHFINAVKRANEENMTIIKNGAKDSQSYIVINDDKGYNVSVQEGKVTGCSCPHHSFRGVICKHMVKVSLERNLDIKIAGSGEEKIVMVMVG